MQPSCRRRARRSSLRRCRSRSRRQMRRQGRLRSTLRPNRHRKSTGASSITLPSYSSTAGSIYNVHLGIARARLLRLLDARWLRATRASSHCLQASRPPGRRSHFVPPFREQEQQLLQAQLAAAAVHQEKQQLLQQARDVKVSIALPPHSDSQPRMGPHLTLPLRPACLIYHCCHA